MIHQRHFTLAVATSGPPFAARTSAIPKQPVRAVGAAPTAVTPEFKEQCNAQGLDGTTQGSAELKVPAASEIDQWKVLADLAGVKAQRS